MTAGAPITGSPINKTSSANILPRDGQLLGFYVHSTSSGTIILYDDAATGTDTAISGTITPAVGWHNYPVNLKNGLYAALANTINVTFVVV